MPEIVNTDQGTQFTGSEFIEKLRSHAMGISVTAWGAGATTCSSSRFWRTLKCEEVYLRAYDTVSEGVTFDRALPRVLQCAPAALRRSVLRHAKTESGGIMSFGLPTASRTRVRRMPPHARRRG